MLQIQNQSNQSMTHSQSSCLPISNQMTHPIHTLLIDQLSYKFKLLLIEDELHVLIRGLNLRSLKSDQVRDELKLVWIWRA